MRGFDEMSEYEALGADGQTQDPTASTAARC